MIRLTQFSPGAGCGCKISPAVLSTILNRCRHGKEYKNLLVGNETSDDAAVYDIGDGKAVISTTDFFMPITDDAADFGRIASANAISDVYAMGGSPMMAIAILGWPLDKLPTELASEVLSGSKEICDLAGIPLAGGHSIDSLEPIFGLAVTGMVETRHLKKNSTARAGCKLYLSKPLGTGILSTAEKKGVLMDEHKNIARDSMIKLNWAGMLLSKLEGVRAMTDVTGFGLAGHLLEMCESSGLQAIIDIQKLPLLAKLDDYISAGCIPGGTKRNFKSYGHKIAELSERNQALICDPQTSGGLLIAVDSEMEGELLKVEKETDTTFFHLGNLKSLDNTTCFINFIE